MEVRITHLNRVKFSIQSRTHTILCDQPADDGGDDMGMTRWGRVRPSMLRSISGLAALL
jgi:hypothetical protein